jgi:hypothetical protein
MLPTPKRSSLLSGTLPPEKQCYRTFFENFTLSKHFPDKTNTSAIRQAYQEILDLDGERDRFYKTCCSRKW